LGTAPRRTYVWRGKTGTLELTEKDLIKQLINLVNEKKNVDLVSHYDKALKSQLTGSHTSAGVAAAIQSVRDKLLKIQHIAQRKRARNHSAASNEDPLKSKSEAEQLSQALPMQVKASLYKLYRQRQQEVERKMGAVKEAVLLPDKTGKNLFSEFIAGIAGVTLPAASEGQQDMNRLMRAYDYEVVKRLGDRLNGGANFGVILQEAIAATMEVPDGVVPLLFKHMQPGCIRLKDVLLTLDDASEIKRIL